MSEEKAETDEQQLQAAQLKKLNLEINALLDQRRVAPRPQRFGRWFVRNATVFTIGLAIVGAITGLLQYNSSIEKDFKKTFWDKQLNLYLDLTGATAKIVALGGERDKNPIAEQEYQRARVRFWELYYGELAVIADKEVDKEIVEFGYCLRLMESNDSRCQPDDLKKKALSLAAACRTSVGTSWQQNLGQFTQR